MHFTNRLISWAVSGRTPGHLSYLCVSRRAKSRCELLPNVGSFSPRSIAALIDQVEGVEKMADVVAVLAQAGVS